jgi:hypothetical protein
MARKFETEGDLISLVGQQESSRLEFKSSTLLAGDKNKVAQDLSREVSAFANSEGGQIIIGMAEAKKGKMRVADHLDGGIDTRKVSPEWIQQLIEANLSPYLPGIRVRSIRLSGPKEGRAAIVISVPQGITAYQANDKRYYGRSEHEVRALPDHEIRFRMMRGRTPQARLEVGRFDILTADQELALRQEELRSIGARQEQGELVMVGRTTRSREDLEAPKRTFDEYLLRFSVANVGEVTIRDFLLVIRFESEFKVFLETLYSLENVQRGTDLPFRFSGSGRFPNAASPEIKIFPGDRAQFPNIVWHVNVPEGANPREGDITVRWVIYLDDAPSVSGEIALGVPSGID